MYLYVLRFENVYEYHLKMVHRKVLMKNHCTIQFEDILMAYFKKMRKPFHAFHIDLIFFLNHNINIELGNYSKLPTSILFKQVHSVDDINKKLFLLWNVLSESEKTEFFNKL